MKEKDESEEKMREEIKRERAEWEKQKLEGKTRREEEDEKRREKEQRVWDDFNEKLKQERERAERVKEDLQSKHEAEENKMKILMEKRNREREELIKKHEEEKERMEREKQGILEDLEKSLKEERNRREEQQKSFDEIQKVLEKQYEDELKKKQVDWREEHDREKEERKKKVCSDTDDPHQVTAYSKLETEYSEWSWSLHSAMMETENKLHNKIENEKMHIVKEINLQKELKKANEKVEKLMSEFFEKDTDADSVKQIITNCPEIKDIDILRDVKDILSETYEGASVNMRESRDIFSVQSYSEYVSFKKFPTKGIKEIVKDALGFAQTLKHEAPIRSLVKDVAQQSDRKIQSFNISKLGYNIRYIQQLTHYIKKRVTEHQEGQVKYVFKDEFFRDLVYSICMRSNKMITDQHRLFRDRNDPVIYVEKKRETYYSIFLKYCHGETPAAIFGEMICQKLKEPIEQSVYKKTARELTDEMRSNCPSLNGNRSKLEKHILKTLAEEEDFDKYMNYIVNPRDHFKSFIRDEVSQYITDKFSVSVLPKMKENIKLLQQKIMKAAHESTEHVQVNRGDVGLWLKSFTQQLSDELIFSEKDLSGVKLDDVDDFSLLEDVMNQKLSATMTDVSRELKTGKLDPKFRPDEILIDHLCQCCWVQCPFCGATCTNTIENHDGDHSVPLHRNNGINGWYYKGTTNLSVEICTSAVASDQSFYPNESDYTVLWKKYRKAGGVYEDWRITPDRSQPPYWKWFVCRFQKDLEKYYSKTFEGNGNIPEEWRKYTNHSAIECLDYSLE
ncbi:Interferon-induced very large GTPase 1 [Labeo rohita]|uniref:Interferon-induced very large GTPase 1 n=1 Tax=Labeo rohita TaxID=84645 RepID=A0ABQ8L5I2_LABRO|nr:Interferon-induced very large GTPase 1 [Labeo rohita]